MKHSTMRALIYLGGPVCFLVYTPFMLHDHMWYGLLAGTLACFAWWYVIAAIYLGGFRVWK